MKNKTHYFIINKPYKILSQFSDENGNAGLGSLYDLPKDVYPVGRLDLDSEGLLILTNDKKLNAALLNPKNGHSRTYWVEVEGIPDLEALEKLRSGMIININKKKHQTLPAKVGIIEDPLLDEREPPVNKTKHPVRSWLSITLIEGKNRQVRRMTAGIGHPTLRLIRMSIENLNLAPLKSGEITQVSGNAIYKKLKISR